MAIVTEKDGTETVGGIVAIRDAFQAVGKGQLHCLECSMAYDHSRGPNGQALSFTGRWSDGTPFHVTHYVPPGAQLAAHARAAARELLEQGKS